MKNLISILFFVLLLYQWWNPWYPQNLIAQTPSQITFESEGVSDFVWSPDGSQLAYIAPYNDTSRLYRIDLDGSNKTELCSDAFGQIDWKDTVIVFRAIDPLAPSPNNILLKKINRNGSGISTIIGPYWYTGVYLRADANWILYRRAPSGWWRAMRCDIEGNNVLEVSHNYLVQQVGWFGTNQILYSRGSNYYTTCGIYKVNFDGSGYLPLTPENLPNNSTFIASPDTDKIIYCDGTGSNWDIWIMDADGNNKTQLTSDPARDYLSNTRDNIWSADGQSFYFVSDRSGNGDIYQINADGSNLRQITTHDSLDYNPIISPDGTKLAFISKRDGVNNIWLIDLFPVGWVIQNSGVTRDLYEVYFTDAYTGTAVGQFGTIVRTINGGLNWITQTSGTIQLLHDVFFNDINDGWIVGSNGTILRTTDGGQNWNSQTSSTSQFLAGVYFTDSNNGWVVGDGGIILRTRNGGTEWMNNSSGITDDLNAVCFVDTNYGTAVGSQGRILRTTNGGSTWFLQPFGMGTPLHDVCFTDVNTGTVVGDFGTILRTTNGGSTWTTQSSGTTLDFRGVSFVNTNTGTVVGLDILRTTDGGLTWIAQTNPAMNYMNSVSFTDANNGTAVGWGGTIIRTWNGGNLTPVNFQLTVPINNGWNLVSIPGLNPLNQNINTWWQYRDTTANVFKYVVGYEPVTIAEPGIGYWMKHSGARIYNTGDEWPADGIQIVSHNPIQGAQGWNLFGGYELSISTADLTTNPPGLITGPVYKYLGSYQVAATLDPGYGYWVRMTGDGQIIIPDLESKGSGEFAKYFREDWGKIIITDNAGRSFTLYAVKGELDLNKYELPPLPPAGMFDVRFGSGRIAEDLSKDIQSIEMSGIQYPFTVEVENMSITLQDETGTEINNELYPGEELKIENRSMHKLIVISGEFIAPIKYSLEQNYPNPFNPTTTINFSIPEATKVTLRIYNVLGEEIDVLVDSELKAGRYSYQWSGRNLATGLYIYELRTDDFSSVKKMLLLK